MATAKKCDRCGKLFEIYNEQHDLKNINAVLTANAVEEAHHYYSGKLLEFCPECCNEFVQWFEKKGTSIDLSNQVENYKE